MYRISIKSISRSAFSSHRCLHSTPLTAKTVKETVSEVADKVNKGIGKGLASAIDKGENVTKATQDTLGAAKSKSSESAKRTMNEANQKADQAASGAKKIKDDVKGEMNK